MNEQTNKAQVAEEIENMSVEQLKEKVAELTKELAQITKIMEDAQERSSYFFKRLEAEREKVRFMVSLLDVLKPEEYISGSEVYKRIAELD